MLNTMHLTIGNYKFQTADRISVVWVLGFGKFLKFGAWYWSGFQDSRDRVKEFDCSFRISLIPEEPIFPFIVSSNSDYHRKQGIQPQCGGAQKSKNQVELGGLTVQGDEVLGLFWLEAVFPLPDENKGFGDGDKGNQKGEGDPGAQPIHP